MEFSHFRFNTVTFLGSFERQLMVWFVHSVIVEIPADVLSGSWLDIEVFREVSRGESAKAECVTTARARAALPGRSIHNCIYAGPNIASEVLTNYLRCLDVPAAN